MCEVNAYLKKTTGENTLLMEHVYLMKPEDNKILLENIFGEQKLVDADIRKVTLLEQTIILQPNQ
ncbi:MAG: CooT family nickel-binding protein [Deltaproteobacteria bacterium]|nr:CooT family nickel-binding protein [Candidatus Anaeroferrophillus wilburensis]MBN2889144.1 CooT family nickel-binding protein [Deltaproteobacteria bacterium]